MASLNSPEQFTTLRRRLDQLGYQHTLGVESLPLVERLFADLIHTTESLRSLKVSQSKRHDLDLAQVGQDATAAGVTSPLELYRADNANLVRENNELHQAIIKMKDSFEENIREMRNCLRKHEHDSTDLKFLNNQYVAKLQAMERESKLKSDRVLALQEKNLHAVIQTPRGHKKSIPFRRQRMEIDCCVPASTRSCGDSSSTNLSSCSQKTDPYIADMLRVADDSIANLCSKVEARDVEIERMNCLLGTGRPRDVVTLENRNSGNERLISHLNIQIDYLQQKISDQSDEILQQKRHLNDTRLHSNANDELMMEIDIKNNENLKLNNDNKHFVKDNANLEDEVVKLRTRITEMDCCRQNLDTLLARAQDDKKKFSLRVNKLVCNERDLILEIDRLKHRSSGKSTHKLKDKSISFDSYVKDVEQQRDYFKREVDSLNAILKTKSTTSAMSPVRHHSPIRHQSRSKSPSKQHVSPPKRSTSPKRHLARTLNSKTSLGRNVLPESMKSSAHYESIIKVMEEERELYQKELELLKLHRCPSMTNLKSSTNLEIERLRNENSDLQTLLSKFERHMAEIQANVKALSTERDSLKNVYNETKLELQTSRKEMLQQSNNSSHRASMHAESMLRRLENEKDTAESELRRSNTERDTLRERLQIATDTQINDRARLEQRIEDLRQSLHKMDVENSCSLDENHKLRKMIEVIEDKQVTSNKELCDAMNNIDKQRCALDQMRSLLEQTERNLNDSEQTVKIMQQELAFSNTKLNAKEEEVRRAIDETGQQRRNLSAVDREKDMIQACADEMTRTVAQLEADIDTKNSLIHKLREALNELDQTIITLQEKMADNEREIQSLRHQTEDLEIRLADSCKGRDIAVHENSRLHDDLETMVKETQNLGESLRCTMAARDLKQQDLHEMNSKNANLDELLRIKDTERGELIKQYSDITAEASRYESISRNLDAQLKAQDLDMNLKANEINKIMKRLHHQEEELNERKIIANEYMNQSNHQAQKISSVEDQLRISNHREQTLGGDLAASRDMAARLERDNEKANSDVTSKLMEIDAMKNQIHNLEAENNNTLKRISNEKQLVEELETVLATNRDKEYKTQLTMEENVSEINSLKDRVSLGDSKLDRQHREITNLRTRNTELDTDIERLKRQLTNEKFEREKTIQELKRRMASNNDYTINEFRTTASSRALALMSRESDGDYTKKMNTDSTIP